MVNHVRTQFDATRIGNTPLFHRSSPRGMDGDRTNTNFLTLRACLYMGCGLCALGAWCRTSVHLVLTFGDRTRNFRHCRCGKKLFGLFRPLEIVPPLPVSLSLDYIHTLFLRSTSGSRSPLCAPDNKVNAILSPLPHGWEREDREHRASDIEKQETRQRERGRGGESPAR